MDRRTFLWTLTAFFGATVVFGLIRTATDDQGAATSIGLQLVALALIVAAIVVVQRRGG
ncbi:MAG: hypothetical protein H0U25_01270 [Thermoleophilaceae bacterium]|jgi:uncharacterized membrane protein YhaH (DUF805 family)|nr:hypothetical protein [Thermoleophilaceae bacterium]